MSAYTLADARATLSAASLSERDIVLPDEPVGNLRMGSLQLVAGDGYVDVVAWDYGTERTLARARSLEEAVQHAVDRWRRTPEVSRRVGRAEYAEWVGEMAERVRSLAPALDAGKVVQTQLPEGSVVDRFGNLDGFLLYPAGTPMAQRSLPPSVLDPTRADHGLLLFGVARPVTVHAARIQPFFGQPGGGVVFRLGTESDTVRDLLLRGDLVVLTVDDGRP